MRQNAIAILMMFGLPVMVSAASPEMEKIKPFSGEWYCDNPAQRVHTIHEFLPEAEWLFIRVFVDDKFYEHMYWGYDRSKNEYVQVTLHFDGTRRTCFAPDFVDNGLSFICHKWGETGAIYGRETFKILPTGRLDDTWEKPDGHGGWRVIGHETCGHELPQAAEPFRIHNGEDPLHVLERQSEPTNSQGSVAW